MKSLKSTMAAALCGLLLIAPATAQQDVTPEEAEYIAALEAELPGSLVNNPLAPNFQTFGREFTTKTVQDDNVAGGYAYRVRVKKRQTNPWDVTVTSEMMRGIGEADVIMIAFWARTESPNKDSGVGRAQVRLQQKAAPYTGVAEGQFDFTSDWQLYYLRGKSDQSYDAEDINMAFNLASQTQTVEIGQFYVMNLGQGVDVDSLPYGRIEE